MTSECYRSALAKVVADVALPSRYLDIRLVGHGATSVVLRAHDSFLAKDVAIKYLKCELSDRTSIRRFQQEAKMLSAFHLMHLPVVLDFGLSTCGRPFMVMELVEGVSLKQTIRERGALPVELSIEITLQLLIALNHAHERGIVHRDLKSQNIMITWTGDGRPFVKLVDFGLAKSTIDSGFITDIGVAVGTPLYMSPEQACGKTTDERSDIYSLGCVFFEMLTGFTPFQRESITRTINAHISETAPKLHSLRNFHSPVISRLESIVERMLEKDPHDRYENAISVSTELEDLILLSRQSDTRQQYKIIELPQSFAATADVVSSRTQWFRRRPMALLILSLVTIILLSTTICSAFDACEPRTRCHLPMYQLEKYALKVRRHSDKFHIADKTAYALPTTTDRDLRLLNEFREIKHVSLVATNVTGGGLNEIEKLGIESLDLDTLTINQSGFDAIGQMQKLAALRLDYQPYLSGAKLAALKQCKRLSSLSISNTYLSRQAQVEISALQGLTELNLDGVAGMNDDTLRLFQGNLPKLRSLSLKQHGRFSDTAISQFRALRSDVLLRI